MNCDETFIEDLCPFVLCFFGRSGEPVGHMAFDYTRKGLPRFNYAADPGARCQWLWLPRNFDYDEWLISQRRKETRIHPGIV